MSESIKQPRSALQILPELENGELVKAISAAMQEMHVAVEEYQKKGTITLTLSYQPGQGAHNAIAIMANLKSKKPEAGRRATVMFTDDEGILTRNDPNQMELQGISIVRSNPTAAAAPTPVQAARVVVDTTTGEVMDETAAQASAS